MNIVDHAQASELFSAYWDRELEPSETARLEEHLTACVVCKREYLAFEKALGGLKQLPPEMAPQGFVKGVAARVRKRSRGRFFASPWGSRRGAERIPYEMFSVVMLAILLAIYVVMQLSQPGRIHLP